MAQHSTRAHAEWPASATAANWACPGRLAMIADIPDPPESEAAAWGTAAHQLAEKCLREGTVPEFYDGQVEKTASHEFEVDDELISCASVYVDYVRDRYRDCGAAEPAAPISGTANRLFIEQQFSLASLDPPFGAGGTADAVIYAPRKRSLDVIDLKGGRGVIVEVKGNPQLRTYALGALLANPGLDVDTVTVTIVQPRAPHKDGRIRSETFHVADLLEWTADLLAAMRRSKQAQQDFDQGIRSVWAAKWLSAGSWCKFCPSAAVCPALEQQAMDAVGVWFDDLDRPHLSNAPDITDPAEIAKKLDLVDMIETWIDALRGHAHRLAETGTEIPGYRLVEKIGRRAWAAEPNKVIYDLQHVVGMTEDQIYVRKLKSPAQIESALGAKRKNAIANMWHAPVTGTNLVSEAKTSRPAAKPAVDKHFDILE